MKKNVFSRTLAVLASTAVLGAASMISASAAGEAISLSDVVGQPGETVTMPIAVSANNDCNSFDLLDHRVWRHYESCVCAHVGAHDQLENYS